MRPAPVVPGSLGVFGGTFDPIHIGHLAVAEEVAETLGLECILFVPAARPPHKPGVEFAPAEDRLAMVRLAIADNPRFAASRLELDRPGPSYMADTLAELAATAGLGLRLADPDNDATDGASRHAADREADTTNGGSQHGHATDAHAVAAGAGRHHLILSADAFAGLPTWHDPRRVLTLARLVVVPREGHADASPASLAAWFPDLPDAASRAIFLDGPRLHLSASALRERVAAGRSLRYLVPDAVRAHIEDHALYRARRRNP